MKIRYNYDSEVDAITVGVEALKSDITLELTEHILVDVTNDGRLVGLEILDASEEISKIFNRAVSKKEIQGLLCEIKKESKNEYIVSFKSSYKKESVKLLIPVYRSPIVAYS